MLLETLPLYLLFEASVLVASIDERRQRARAARAHDRERDSATPGL
jgi:Sec-independent protein secretion pathway component TatC